MNIKIICEILYIKIYNDSIDKDDKNINMELEESINNDESQIIVKINNLRFKRGF